MGIIVKEEKVYVIYKDKTIKGVVKDYKSKTSWFKPQWLEYLILTEDEQLIWIHEDNIYRI